VASDSNHITPQTPMPKKSNGKALILPAGKVKTRALPGNIPTSFLLLLAIVEKKRFHYAAVGAAFAPDNKRVPNFGNPDWEAVRSVVRKNVSPVSSYTRGKFPIAGFWRPDATPAWILPGELSYASFLEEI